MARTSRANISFAMFLEVPGTPAGAPLPAELARDRLLGEEDPPHVVADGDRDTD
jgi:hypothetical protein